MLLTSFQPISTQLNNAPIAQSTQPNPYNYYYKALLPANLNLNDLLKADPFSGLYYKNKPQYHIDILTCIVSTLIKQYHIQKQKSTKNDDSEFVRLCSKLLKQFVGNYKDYVNWMIRNNIIAINGSWQERTTCMGYKLVGDYANSYSNTKTVYIYGEKLLEHKRKRSQKQTTIDKYSDLYGWLNELTYDKQISNGILNKLYRNDRTILEIQREKLEKLDDIRKATFRLGNTERLYTPLTHLKTELRDALRYKNQKIVEVDIKSSIPYMTLVLFNRGMIYKYDSVINRYSKMGGEELIKYIMCPEKGEVVTDILQYKKDILSNDIYIKLCNVWNERLNKQYDRKSAKKKFLAIINSPNFINPPEKQILQEIYPTVIKVIDKINGFFLTNRMKKGKAYSEENRSAIAYITQTIESNFVLDVVCKKLTLEHPEIPLWTIHDAIYTIAPYRDIVANMLKECSIQEFGVNCQLG